MRLVVFGLSLSSSWGNGHATTFRALLKAFAARGHQIRFLERDVPWYAEHRDLNEPDYCDLVFYSSLDELRPWTGEIERADAVLLGSYVPEGISVARFIKGTAKGVTAFYDIDTPITLAKISQGECDYVSRDTIAQFDLYLSFTGGPTLELIETRFQSPAARALYCSVDAAHYTPTGAPKRWDLSYLGTYSPDRQPSLERLLLAPARALPQCRFVVAGPQYPTEIVWPDNVERIEHLPPAAHADFYSSSVFTLNVTRADMIEAGWSPSVRLFEAAACGTAIISDIWDGIETLFTPDAEILLARGMQDVIDALTRRAAETIGLAGRARVLAGHTAEHRAAELENHLEKASARSRSTARVVGDGVRGENVRSRRKAQLMVR